MDQKPVAMKVMGMIASPTDPASRFRILQYRGPLRTKGIHLDCPVYYPLRDADPSTATRKMQQWSHINSWRSWNILKIAGRLPILARQFQYDLLWQNRLILPHHSLLETFLRKPLVFDFDDAIWMTEGSYHVDKVLQKASHVFAGNAFLGDYARKFNKCVTIIHPAIDSETYYPDPRHETPFTIGWIGTRSNFHNLELIREAVHNFLETHPDARFRIISTEAPPGFNYDGERFCFELWDMERENQQINQFSIGLMPLYDSEWNRGKCSYKMLQYMACGKPVVVSPVGMNQEVLKMGSAGFAARTTTEWEKAFVELKQDAALYHACSREALQIISEHFTIRNRVVEIEKIFRDLI
ncbi:MAG TPA: glycosyltransferase family 4 protein [Flavisolibacter sp.]|jgi:glycosyltransferase involved in cell wall biosynthesis|nr:glycosyltransferase family 4 protein [Flavisolibacter sp.]